jgi:hypothetical protein
MTIYILSIYMVSVISTDHIYNQCNILIYSVISTDHIYTRCNITDHMHTQCNIHWPYNDIISVISTSHEDCKWNNCFLCMKNKYQPYIIRPCQEFISLRSVKYNDTLSDVLKSRRLQYKQCPQQLEANSILVTRVQNITIMKKKSTFLKLCSFFSNEDDSIIILPYS